MRINEKSKINIMKTIYSQLIVSRIVDVLTYIKGTHPNSVTQIINKAVLTEGVYEEFLLKFVYNQKMSYRSIRAFMNVYVVYQTTQAGHHYEKKIN